MTTEVNKQMKLGKWTANDSCKYNVRDALDSVLRFGFGRIFLYASIVVFEVPIETSLKSLSWTATALLSSAKRAKIEIREATIEDIQKFRRLKEFQGKRILRVEERFRADHVCFVAEKGEKIVSYAWIAFREAYVDAIEREIHIDPYSAYLYNEYTDPAYRGRGIMPAVLIETFRYLSQKRFKEEYSVAYLHNFPAMRVHSKLGARRMGTVSILRLSKLIRYKCKSETERDFHALSRMFAL